MRRVSKTKRILKAHPTKFSETSFMRWKRKRSISSRLWRHAKSIKKSEIRQAISPKSRSILKSPKNWLRRKKTKESRRRKGCSSKLKNECWMILMKKWEWLQSKSNSREWPSRTTLKRKSPNPKTTDTPKLIYSTPYTFNSLFLFLGLKKINGKKSYIAIQQSHRPSSDTIFSFRCHFYESHFAQVGQNHVYLV